MLAADVVSAVDVPPADNTSMDGYALRAADVALRRHGAAGQPTHRRGRRRRGRWPTAARRASSPARKLPAGADAVVMQEQCEALDGAVRVNALPQVGQWIRRRGEDVRSGATVLARGVASDAAGTRAWPPASAPRP